MMRFSSAHEYIQLADLGDPESEDRLRHGVASEAVWAEIIRERPDLIHGVALNKELPEIIIRNLANNTDPTVRYFIASKRSLPLDLFEQLSKDHDESVRATVAVNKKTPREFLERLANDECPLVSERARERLSHRQEDV